MSNEVTRTPAQVAADINTIKSHTSAVLRSAIDEGKRSCIRIGKLLEEAKCLVPHGEWGKWLEENVDYSESTAQNLMRCYREFGDEQIDLFSGVSDADFFAVLSQSQMLELLALPKERRREFVEEHREELESGEMSVRDMKAEIARLKAENAGQAEDIRFNDETYNKLLEEFKQQGEALEEAEGNIENLNKHCAQLVAMLDEEKKKPAPEPVVQEVIVHQPSEEQIEAIRAEQERKLREEFERTQSQTLKECREEVEAAEKERDKAIEKAAKEANDAGEMAKKVEKIQADHKAAMEKLKAEHDKKIADLEATYKKQAKASAAGQDANVTRIQITLESFKRDLTSVSAILGKMRAEGGEQAQKADKLQANVERILGGLISEAGWTL